MTSASFCDFYLFFFKANVIFKMFYYDAAQKYYIKKMLLLKVLYMFSELVALPEYNHDVKCLLKTGWDVIHT